MNGADNMQTGFANSSKLPQWADTLQETGREILELLKKEHESGLTIVMVTHDRQIADLTDRTVILNRGQVE